MTRQKYFLSNLKTATVVFAIFLVSLSLVPVSFPAPLPSPQIAEATHLGSNTDVVRPYIFASGSGPWTLTWGQYTTSYMQPGDELRCTVLGRDSAPSGSTTVSRDGNYSISCSYYEAYPNGLVFVDSGSASISVASSGECSRTAQVMSHSRTPSSLELGSGSVYMNAEFFLQGDYLLWWTIDVVDPYGNSTRVADDDTQADFWDAYGEGSFTPTVPGTHTIYYQGYARGCGVSVAAVDWASNTFEVTDPPNYWNLNVSVSGLGNVYGPGISCPGDCSEIFQQYRAIVPTPTLSVAPASGWTFAGWGGDAASCGTNTDCSVRMDNHKNVTATFNPPPPPTVNLYTNTNTINLGQSATLTWSSSGADSCVGTSSPAYSGWNNTSKALNNSTGEVVNPTITTTFYLTCTNAGGSNTSGQTINVNQTGTITVSSNLSTSWTINPGGISGSGTSGGPYTVLPGSGCTLYTITPAGQTNYTYAVSPGTQAWLCPGGTINFAISYSAVAVSASLSATETTINLGQSSRLDWVSSGANSCSAWWTGSTAVSGSQWVSPTVTTDYSITCSGPGGTVTSNTVRITVITTATITVYTDPNINTSWTINPGGISGSGMSGTHTVSPGASGTTYTLTPAALPNYSVSVANYDDGDNTMTVYPGQANRIFVIYYTPLPPSMNLQVNGGEGPITINNGDAASISWTSSNTNSCSAISPSGWTSSTATSGGPVSVQPNSTTTYTMSCTGPGGSVSDSVTINVVTTASITVSSNMSTSWTINPGGISGSGTSGGPYIVTPSPSGTSYFITPASIANYNYTVSPGTSIFLRAGQSGSFTINYSPILNPPTLGSNAAASPQCERATLTFTDNSVSENRFLYYRDNDSNADNGSVYVGEVLSTTANTTGTVYTTPVDVVIGGGTYYYHIRAYRDDGVYSAMVTSNAVTLAECPPAISANIRVSQVTRNGSTFNYSSSTRIRDDDILTLDITLSNLASAVASNIVTSTTLTPNFEYQSGTAQISRNGSAFSPTSATYNSNNLNIPASGSLGLNDLWTIRFQARVNSSVSGSSFDRVNADGSVSYTYFGGSDSRAYNLNYLLVYLLPPQPSQVHEVNP